MTDTPTTPEREAVARLEVALASGRDWAHFAPRVARSDLQRLLNALAKADAILARGCPEGWGEPVFWASEWLGHGGLSRAAHDTEREAEGNAKWMAGRHYPLYAAPQPCPEGWVMVPREAAENAFCTLHGEGFEDEAAVFSKALDAAPQPSGGEG